MTSAAKEAIEEACSLLEDYEQFLTGKALGTKDAYLRTVRHLIAWVAECPDNEGRFQPRQLTQSVVELYLTHLEEEGFSLNHRTRVKSTISNFAQFLIEEKGLLQRNPTRGIALPPLPLLLPQQISPEQRSILRALIKQAGDRRGAALFALGYWAGCRVSDLSWLQMADVHVGPKEGWIHVGSHEGKARDIDLLNKAREPLYAYLQATGDKHRTYVFISQRSERLTEEAIHYWFRTLKVQGTKRQAEVVQDLTFNDLRHDFGERARGAGWSFEEVVYYMGYVNRTGVAALQTAGGHAEVIREHIKQKLKNFK